MENGTEMAKKARAFVYFSNLNALGDELNIVGATRRLRAIVARRESG